MLFGTLYRILYEIRHVFLSSSVVRKIIEEDANSTLAAVTNRQPEFKDGFNNMLDLLTSKLESTIIFYYNLFSFF